MAISAVSVNAPSTANKADNRTNSTGSALSDKAQLNLASSVLTQDVIDSLKDADEGMQIKPLTKRIEQNSKQQADVTALTTLMSQFKTSYADVANETAMLKRKVSASGSGSVSLSAEAGVREQTIRLSVSQLAQVDSYQSKGFSSRSATLEGITKDEEITMNIGDKSVNLKIGATTTLEDIMDQINDSGAIRASIVNTGDKDGAYKLIFQSKDTGTDHAISFSSKGDGSDESAIKILNELGFGATKTESKDDEGNTVFSYTIDANDSSKGGKQLQKAQDANFTYNGIEITRSSNTIDDLIIGATFTLNSVDEKNSTTGALKESVLTIGRDTEAVGESLKNMVNAYNDLLSNINTSTSYDKETGAAGYLNGMNEITGMKKALQNLFNTPNVNGKSLQDFGFSFNEKGVMSLDTAKLNKTIEEDFEGFKEFFTSGTSYTNASVFSSGAITGDTLKDGVSGKLKINGKEIELDLKSGEGIKNANELVKLINDAGIDNIKASITESGALQISSSYGTNVEIDGDSEVLSKLGLKKETKQGSKSDIEGFFAKLNKVIDGYIGQKGTLTNLSDGLKDKAKLMGEQKTKVQESLDKKYSLMQTQFATYAVQMNSLTNQFNSLQSTMEALLNSNKK